MTKFTGQITQMVVIRETGMVTDQETMAWCLAFQTAYNMHFAPAWTLPTITVTYIPPGHIIPPGVPQIVLLDNSDQASALGYHDNLGPGGVPISKIFVKDAIATGVDPSITFTHEGWEMGVDPNIDRTVRRTVNGVTMVIALEAADAVEDDQFAFIQSVTLDGVKYDVKISAFQTPAFFEENAPGPHCFPPGIVTKPFELADGGYSGEYEESPVPGQWTQRFAEIASPRQIKDAHSRTMRRFAK